MKSPLEEDDCFEVSLNGRETTFFRVFFFAGDLLPPAGRDGGSPGGAVYRLPRRCDRAGQPHGRGDRDRRQRLRGPGRHRHRAVGSADCSEATVRILRGNATARAVLQGLLDLCAWPVYAQNFAAVIESREA